MSKVKVNENGVHEFLCTPSWINDKEDFALVNPVLAKGVCEKLFEYKFIPNNVTRMDYNMPQVCFYGTREDCLNLIGIASESEAYINTTIVFRMTSLVKSCEKVARKKGKELKEVVGRNVYTFEDCKGLDPLFPTEKELSILKARHESNLGYIDDTIDIYEVNAIEITKDSTLEERLENLNETLLKILDRYNFIYNVNY